MSEFVGQNFRGMLLSLAKKHNLVLPPDLLDTYCARELGKVVEALEQRAKPCPGSVDVLRRLYEAKTYGMAVVSSSALPRVKASLVKVGQDGFFPQNHIFSAASSLPKPTSKPDPAVYLFACEQIGVDPKDCVAVEDSKSGATAAMRAGIPLIGYVGSYIEEGKDKVDEMARVLTEQCKAITIMYDWKEFDKCLETVISA